MFYSRIVYITFKLPTTTVTTTTTTQSQRWQRRRRRQQFQGSNSWNFLFRCR